MLNKPVAGSAAGCCKIVDVGRSSARTIQRNQEIVINLEVAVVPGLKVM
jgi:hypothetical protein